MTPESKLLPASGQCKSRNGPDPAGKPVRCQAKATMFIAAGQGHKVCDRHTEPLLQAICGRPTTIVRREIKEEYRWRGY